MITLADRCYRPAVAAHPAAATTPALPGARRRTPHRARPGLHGRDHLHGTHLHPVGAAAGGRVRLRQRDDLLAAVAQWAHAGVFERLQELLLDELGQAGQLEWSRVGVDSFSLRALRGDQVGANPVDRAKPGSKLHLAVDGTGLPLSLLVTGANTNDSLVFAALLDDLPQDPDPSGPAALP